MIKDIQRIMDFTNSQCISTAYRSVLVEDYGGIATHLTGLYIDGENLSIQYNEVPLKDILSIEYGYFSDEHKDRLEKVYVDSIEDVQKYVTQKRYQNLEYIHYIHGVISHCSYFPFYEVDKIGSGYVFIETKTRRYEIFYPTRKITCEKREVESEVNSDTQKTSK